MASKLDGRCATQASKWEERQGLIRDTIKLLNDDDSLELLKAILSSPTQMQLQNDNRGDAQRARATLRNLSGSPRANWNSMTLSGKSADFSKVVSIIEEMVLFVQEEVDCRC